MPIALFAIFLFILSNQVLAAEIKIAVASNFKPAMEKLKIEFERQSSHRIKLIYGSSSKHYAQIINGAPYDAFFSADRMRPKKLEKNGKAIAKTRFTYALGKLVLWGNLQQPVNARLLAKDNFKYLAIANPKLAPYGQAAVETLKNLKLWQKLKTRLVRGENINQAFQFVQTSNAELGLVARSQLIKANYTNFWLVPQNLYTPIIQQAISIKDKPAVKEFMGFIRSVAAKKIIRESGYE